MKQKLLFLIGMLPNFLKLFIYRKVCKYDIDSSVKIGFGTILDASTVVLGKKVTIGSFCRLNLQDLRMLTGSSIDPMCTVFCHTLVLSSRSSLSSAVKVSGNKLDSRSVLMLGTRAAILRECYVDVTRSLIVGKGTGIGGRSCIFTHGSWLPETDGFPVGFGSVTIEKNVWIPWECFIMPGVTIGENAIIGARSVVNKSVKPGHLVAGAPIKVIREQTKKELTTEDRLEVIRKITADFALQNNLAVLEKGDGEAATFTVGSSLSIVVYLSEKALPLSGQLNIFLNRSCKTQDFMKKACFSLLDFSSSPEETFDECMKEWFVQASNRGLRYYPTDEESDVEQAHLPEICGSLGFIG